MHRLKAIKDCLVDCVECELLDIKHTNTEELGEVVDMIKDLEEAMYYCAKIKEMHHDEDKEDYHDAGRSYLTRCEYIKHKASTDKTLKMKMLEKYMQELSQDIMEMIDGISLEERQLLEKKMTMLTTKISQLNV